MFVSSRGELDVSARAPSKQELWLILVLFLLKSDSPVLPDFPIACGYRQPAWACRDGDIEGTHWEILASSFLVPLHF